MSERDLRYGRRGGRWAPKDRPARLVRARGSGSAVDRVRDRQSLALLRGVFGDVEEVPRASLPPDW